MYTSQWPQEAHAHPQWGKAFRMQRVQLQMCTSWYPKDSHAHPQWRKTFHLQRVQLQMCTSCSPENPHAHPQWRQTFHLQAVQLLLHSFWQFKDTHEKAQCPINTKRINNKFEQTWCLFQPKEPFNIFRHLTNRYWIYRWLLIDPLFCAKLWNKHIIYF